jgi:phosphate uptake regulator
MIPSETKSGLWKVISVCALLTALILAPVTSSKAQIAPTIRFIVKTVEVIGDEAVAAARRIPKPKLYEITALKSVTSAVEFAVLHVLVEKEKDAAVLEKVLTFYALTEEDDPYEYDFGAFE